MEFAAEVYEACRDSIEEYSQSNGAYGAGRVLGRITGEIAVQAALAALSAGVGNVILKSETAAAAFARIATLSDDVIPLAVKADLAPVAAKCLELLSSRICFIAGTMVVTAEGRTAIEAIEPGMLVLSRDPRSAAVGWKPVTATFVTRPASLVQVTYAGDGRAEPSVLTCTPNHPFYVEELGDFTAAGELQCGEHHLTDEASASIEVCEIGIARGPPCDADPIVTINLEVGDWHTYFVAPDAEAPAVWVHNLGRICEKADAILMRIHEATPEIKHWDAAVQALQKTSSSQAAAETNVVISQLMEVTMERMFTEATPSGGPVDLTKLKTVTQLKAFKTTAEGLRLKGTDLDFHHTVQKSWAKILLAGKPGMPAINAPDSAWQELLDDMPGFAMRKKDHIGSPDGIGEGSSGFHRILRSKLKDGALCANMTETNPIPEFSVQGGRTRLHERLARRPIGSPGREHAAQRRDPGPGS